MPKIETSPSIHWVQNESGEIPPLTMVNQAGKKYVFDPNETACF